MGVRVGVSRATMLPLPYALHNIPRMGDHPPNKEALTFYSIP
jgi:hypothetical protein